MMNHDAVDAFYHQTQGNAGENEAKYWPCHISYRLMVHVTQTRLRRFEHVKTIL